MELSRIATDDLLWVRILPRVPILMEGCQSLVYWNSLENCRTLIRFRGSESHTFLQFGRCSQMVLTPVWKTGGCFWVARVQFLHFPPIFSIRKCRIEMSLMESKPERFWDRLLSVSYPNRYVDRYHCSPPSLW